MSKVLIKYGDIIDFEGRTIEYLDSSGKKGLVRFMNPVFCDGFLIADGVSYIILNMDYYVKFDELGPVKVIPRERYKEVTMENKVLSEDEVRRAKSCVYNIKDKLQAVETELSQDRAYCSYLVEKLEPILNDTKVILSMCRKDD